MLVNLYSAKTPIAVFSLPILVGLLSIPIFFFPYVSYQYFWNWQNNLEALVSNQKWLNYLVSVVLVSINAHQLNNVYNSNSFYSKATFLPGMIYVLILFNLNMLHFGPPLIAHLFIIFSMGQLLTLKQQEGAKQQIFWAAFFIGIASTFSSLTLVLILLPWLALMAIRPFVWREWFMVLLGGAIPLFYYISISILVKGKFDLEIAPDMDFVAPKMGLFEVSSYGLLVLIIIGSLVKYLGVMRAQVNRFKNLSLIVFHAFWLGLITWSVGFYFFDQLYISFIIPLSFFIGTSFLHASRASVINGIVIIWLIISAANVLGLS